MPFWVAYREALRAAWYSAFADEYVIRLLNIPAATVPITQPRQLSEADRASIADAEDALKQQAPPMRMTHTLEFEPIHPFQRDILTLVRSTGKAKLCELCHQPFVADKPGRHYCPIKYRVDGETCAERFRTESRRPYKREQWRKHGKKWRKSSKRAAAKISNQRRRHRSRRAT